jgi:hypothetical protein
MFESIKNLFRKKPEPVNPVTQLVKVMVPKTQDEVKRHVLRVQRLVKSRSEGMSKQRAADIERAIKNHLSLLSVLGLEMTEDEQSTQAVLDAMAKGDKV